MGLDSMTGPNNMQGPNRMKMDDGIRVVRANWREPLPLVLIVHPVMAQTAEAGRKLVSTYKRPFYIRRLSGRISRRSACLADMIS